METETRLGVRQRALPLTHILLAIENHDENVPALFGF
jgi:hypothetical protein